MESSTGAGFMAVFAVSGSVVLLAILVHKRLLSDFMKKIESELGSEKFLEPKKKAVRFAEDVIEPSSNNKEYRKRRLRKTRSAEKSAAMEELTTMPINRRVLYKGIIEFQSLKGHKVPNCMQFST